MLVLVRGISAVFRAYEGTAGLDVKVPRRDEKMEEKDRRIEFYRVS